MLTRKLKITGLLFLAAIAALVLWSGYGAVERYYLQQLASQNQATLRLVESGLQGALLRYEPLTPLLADKPAIKNMLMDPGNDRQINSVNLQLMTIAQDIGASDIFVMDATGMTLAASNFQSEKSFVGGNFSFRPYFQGAMKGTSTRYFALGTTSLKRGYYFAAPVRNNGKIIGVVGIKIAVDGIEKNWRGPSAEIMVADTNGIIFMASRHEWLFKSLNPLSDLTLNKIRESKRYPIEKLSLLENNVSPSGITNSPRITISVGTVSQSYLAQSKFMPRAGWTLYVMTTTTGASNRAFTSLMLASLAVLLLVLLTAVILQRRARLVRNMTASVQAQEQLELRVAERTLDLNKTNKKLTKEVAERKLTEEQLRSTQNELIQAGKLAALGQMSAALSHELNQPLTAIKSYAENARTYLKRNKIDQADQNISYISDMSDRMAELGSHLRNFARKPRQVVDAVDLGTVMAGVRLLIDPRMKGEGAELITHGFDDELFVLGGQNRLQQVLLNLINNALDAMSGQNDPVVTISVEAKDDGVSLCVRDTGTGLEDAIAAEMFDPFFTTKGVNEGLGLGLSISYNIVRDFGGHLSAVNHNDGGAVFTVWLKRAQKYREAGQ